MIFMRYIFTKAFVNLGKLLTVTCLALTVLPAYAQAQETVWFVVAERSNVQNPTGFFFLLPLSDPSHIAQARQMIENPSPTSSVSARIAIGGDGFNRDVLAEGDPAWSWRVTEFRLFYDVTTGDPCFTGPLGVEVFLRLNSDCTSYRFPGFLPVAELEAPPEFFISEGLNGTWYNLETAGQGVTVDVLAERGEVFLTWVTYADGGPTGPPADEQAWITAQGPFTGNAATLDAFVTTGGAFDSPASVTTRPIGQIELEFSDCNHGVLSYAFDDGQSGQFPIRRLINRPGCVSRLADIRRRDEPD